MNTRSIIFENFRNLGISDSKQENLSNKLQLGSIDREHIGGLLDLLGGNNDGKSNGLDGLVSLGEKNLCKDDIPNFIGYENKIPKLILQYEITTQDKISAIKNVENEVDRDSKDIESNFTNKTFGMFFTPDSIDNCKRYKSFNSDEECKEYWQNILDSDLYAIYDYDEQNDKSKRRPEIRIISKKYNFVFFCSTQTDNEFPKSMFCFMAIRKNINEIKHSEHAIKINCKFFIHFDSKTPKNCDDASLLRQFLKEDFETRTYSSKDIQPTQPTTQKSESLCYKAILSFENDKTIYRTTLPKKETQHKYADSEILKKIQDEFKQKFMDWESIKDYANGKNCEKKSCIEQYNLIVKKYKLIENTLHIPQFVALYNELKKLFKHLESEYSKFVNITEFIDLESLQTSTQDIDVIAKTFDIPFMPKIILYKEQALSDKDLESSGDNLENSAFFTMLFKILEVNITDIQNDLKSAANKRKARERDLDKRCEKINERFNALYCLSDDVYNFSMRLEDNKIAFCMEKNNEAIYLKQQSTGFRKFFNLFFNFLYKGEIGRGDIVLIDEPENSLSIPAQRDLRKFLKDYGRKSGILFIIATHSPSMLDITHLDEVRIVKALNSLESSQTKDSSDEKDPKKGSLIINDFSMLGYGKSDTLDSIRKALGTDIEFDKTKLIFVEGIMDSNILNAYSQIYDDKDSNKLIFLPISGLGGKGDLEASDNNELSFSLEQKQKAQNLITFAKRLRIHPILLVDNDRAGKAMQQGVEDEEEFKNDLSVITLKDIFENASGEIKNKVYAIESLFSDEDRKKFGFNTCKENKQSNIVSSVFKNTENLKEKLSQESKKNFNELFAYLVGLKEADE